MSLNFQLPSHELCIYASNEGASLCLLTLCVYTDVNIYVKPGYLCAQASYYNSFVEDMSSQVLAKIDISGLEHITI
jgi:hypothetical protein